MKNQKIKKTVVVLISLLCLSLGSTSWADKSGNLWQDMSGQFGLHYDPQRTEIQKVIKTLVNDPTYLGHIADNARPYLYYMYQETERRHLPAELAFIPIIESDYSPFVYSKTGAVGFWQMMPGTASGFNVDINWWFDGRRDIVQSTNAALDYFVYLHKQFGDWLLAIAAYDSGEGTVKNAIAYNKKHHLPTDFWSLNLPNETQNYVPRLLAIAEIVKHTSTYHANLPVIADQPVFSVVQIHDQIDLNRLASVINTNIDLLHTLNPGFRRWATPPDETYNLLIPVEKLALYNAKQSELQEQTAWIHHQVQIKESLQMIASHYHTSIALLVHMNNLEDKMVHANEDLLVPKDSSAVQVQTSQVKPELISADHLPGPQSIEHVVKPHETLKSIAANYNTTVAKLIYWNHLDNTDPQPEQKLIIWSSPSEHASHSHKHSVMLASR